MYYIADSFREAEKCLHINACANSIALLLMAVVFHMLERESIVFVHGKKADLILSD